MLTNNILKVCFLFIIGYFFALNSHADEGEDISDVFQSFESQWAMQESDSARAWLVSNAIDASIAVPDQFMLVSYAEKGLLFFSEQDDYDQIRKIQNFLIYTYYLLGDYDHAHTYAFEAYHIAAQESDTSSMILALDYMTSILDEFGEKPAKILAYRMEAVDLSFVSKDTTSIILSLINVGDHYLGLGNLDSAKYFTHKALSFSEQKNDSLYIGFCYINLCEASVESEDFAKALFYGKSSLRYLKEHENQLELSYSHELLGLAYKGMDDLYNALDHFQKALKYAKQKNAKSQQVELYKELSALFEVLGSYDKALEYHKEFVSLKDSLSKNVTDNKVAYYEQLYQAEKDLIKLQQLNKENQKKDSELSDQHLINLFLGIISLLILALLFWSVIEIKRRKTINQSLLNYTQRIKEQNIEIEEQKKIIEQRSEYLEDENQHLDEMNEEISYLMGVVAHDLKSPLKQIDGLITIVKMEEGDLSENQKVCLDKVSESSKRLSRMINKLLDLQVVEQKKQNLVFDDYNLTEIVDKKTDAFTFRAEDKNLVFEKNFSPNVLVHADEELVNQILDNLISNALKFSPTGKKIFMTVGVDEGRPYFQIEDQGNGFSEEDKKHLFKKFKKLSARPTAGEDSTGLGLSIVKRYVDLMQCDIVVLSEQGKGASFKVLFPAVG